MIVLVFSSINLKIDHVIVIGQGYIPKVKLIQEIFLNPVQTSVNWVHGGVHMHYAGSFSEHTVNGVL